MKKSHFFQKKNPNDAVNKFKLKFVNKLLSQSNDYLADKYKPFDDFDSFDEDDIPQNSDVVLYFLSICNALRSKDLIMLLLKMRFGIGGLKAMITIK